MNGNRINTIDNEIFFLVLLLVPSFVVSAEFYKCKQENGNYSFSDGPCPKGTVEEKMESAEKEDDWLDRLRREKSSNIKIIDIHRKEDEVIIRFEFKTISDPNDFVRLADSISDMTVVLTKYMEPKNGASGWGEVKVSNKPNPLLDSFKRNIK